ncbi:hypothetical protein PHMEG_0009010 [Phytophthora megakarya]|uniref:Uncharacterized protein n=1 Tax=Phytophthora megakarya TaxID=4795 RepID=A0A225WH78_9STRA|nr:hypothetical protein PHMEG_0009010 [Phytophthora megakarya]
MELVMCVDTLIFLQSTAELEYASQFHVVGARHYQRADYILLKLAALVSSHASNLVRQEFELSKGGSRGYGGRWLEDSMVQHTKNTMLLPGRHTIFVRSNVKMKKLIPINYILPRWLLQSEANRPDEDESEEDISVPPFEYKRHT